MGAAATSGYASRPLPLFYAVSQAGRAIAAAWADQPWVLAGHGLKHEVGATPLKSRVKPDPGSTDSFSHVADAAAQGTLTAPVELGALWTSLTDLYGQGLRDEPWRRPLIVRRSEPDVEHWHMRGPWACGTVVVEFDRFPHSAIINVDDPCDPSFDQTFASELAHYPTADGWVPWRPGGLPHDRRDYDAWTVEVAWPAGDQHVTTREAAFREHVYEHRYRDEWWLRPALNEEGDYMLPLMTWWVLLFGLSMHARYHPAEWTTALRVDKHDETVPLEAAMDVALSAVPHYVLDALYGVPVFLGRR